MDICQGGSKIALINGNSSRVCMASGEKLISCWYSFGDTLRGVAVFSRLVLPFTFFQVKPFGYHAGMKARS